MNPKFKKDYKLRARRRRVAVVLLLAAGLICFLIANPESYETAILYGTESAETGTETDAGDTAETVTGEQDAAGNYYATAILAKLEIKAQADGSTYNRKEQFYSTWPSIDGCSLRQRILKRDFDQSTLDSDNCTVISGTYTEPYTGQVLTFSVRSEISSGIQIDHIVALSNAWKTGAQNLTFDQRYSLATDTLNLIAAESSANQAKSDADASEWLPENTAFRCEYVARQVSVKYKYNLWVTQAEHDAIAGVLADCPAQTAIVE